MTKQTKTKSRSRSVPEPRNAAERNQLQRALKAGKATAAQTKAAQKRAAARYGDS